MQTICELLDLAKSKNPEISSDRRLALALGVTDLSHYRKRRVAPNDATATRLAELCGLSPEVVIATCHAAKAETPEVKRAWANLYKLAANACLTVAVAWMFSSCGSTLIPATYAITDATTSGAMYIM